MRALIITKSSSVIINVMNFLVSVGYEPANIVTIMSLYDNIYKWWDWLMEGESPKFVYLDPGINDLTFSNEPFTPQNLRSLLYSSKKELIVAISSSDIFEMYWMYGKSRLTNEKYSLSRSCIYTKTKVKIIILSGNTRISAILPMLKGVQYRDIPKYYDVQVSFGVDGVLDEYFF